MSLINDYVRPINELASALSKAQSEIKGAKKDVSNTFFKSKYADLASVWEAIREPLTKNGLSVTQLLETVNDKLHLKTILMHSSGQTIESLMPVFMKDQSPQAMGSAVSYARRYALAAIVGVPQIDDDAEAAEERPVQKTAFNKILPDTEDERKAKLVYDVFKIAKESNWDTGMVAAHVKEKYNVSASKLLSEAQLKELVVTIKADKRPPRAESDRATIK